MLNNERSLRIFEFLLLLLKNRTIPSIAYVEMKQSNEQLFSFALLEQGFYRQQFILANATLAKISRSKQACFSLKKRESFFTFHSR